MTLSSSGVLNASTQYSTSYVVDVDRTGSVTESGSVTRFSASGTNRALVGEAAGPSSTFRETAPAPAKVGTFTRA